MDQEQIPGGQQPASTEPGAQPVQPMNSGSEAQPQIVSPLQPEPKSRGKLFIYIAIAVVVLLACGALYYFVWAQNGPEKVWNNYAQLTSATQKPPATFHFDGNLDLSTFYSDNPVKVKLSINSDVDNRNADQLKAKADLNASLSMGAISYSLNDLQFLENGDELYINVANIPYVSQTLDKKYQGWVKLSKKSKDFQDLGLPTSSTSTSAWLKDYKFSDFISGHQYIGKEKIAGQDTYHYTLTINKDGIKQLISKALDQEQSDSANSQAVLKELLESQSNTFFSNKANITAFIDQTKITKADVWVGKADGQTKQLQLAIQLPIPKTVKCGFDFDFALNSCQGDSGYSAPAAKKLADVRQLETALELYYNDNGGYPVSLSALTPIYVGSIPVPPQNPAGNCANAANSYMYAPQGAASPKSRGAGAVFPSYRLAFCLESDTGGYKAGLYHGGPEGITVDQPFTAVPPPAPKPDDLFVSGQTTDLNIGMTISKGPDNLQINVPPQAYDLLNEFGNPSGPTPDTNQPSSFQKSDDAKRLADMRQAVSSLELYFNDNNAYPVASGGKPVGLVPTYIGAWPKAPPVRAGEDSCSSSQNEYNYTSYNAQMYSLTFCLGTTTGGLSAGMHTASPSGIQ